MEETRYHLCPSKNLIGGTQVVLQNEESDTIPSSCTSMRKAQFLATADTGRGALLDSEVTSTYTVYKLGSSPHKKTLSSFGSFFSIYLLKAFNDNQHSVVVKEPSPGG